MAVVQNPVILFGAYFSPAQQQLWMVLALKVAVYEVGQQVFQDIGGVLQLALQHCHDKRGHVAAVPHGEATLGLESANETQQVDLVVNELAEELQPLLHLLLAVARHL